VKRSVGLIGAVAVAALVWAAISYYRYAERSAALRIEVAGGDGGGLPLARPEIEHFDAAALERVTRDPAAAGLQALIIVRHGHLVFERFGHGISANTLIDSGAFAPALVALVAGATLQQSAPALAAVGRFDASRWRDAIEHATGHRYTELLGHRVWARLNAAPAYIALATPNAAAPVDCCFHARVQDWMRIGGLLVDGGDFEGTQVVTASWITRMRQPASADGLHGLGIELAASAHGATPLATADAVFLRGPGRWRLWAVPSLHLVVLFGSEPGGDAGPWDETRLPNLVLAAVTDRTGPQNPELLLQRLVPHH
jgi:hypothetical protein